MNALSRTRGAVFNNGRIGGETGDEKMTATTTMENISFTAKDNSGQRRYAVRNYRSGATVGDLIHGLVERMGLRSEGAETIDDVYHAFSGREGRHLRSAEIIGDVIEEGDEIILRPDVQAGGA